MNSSLARGVVERVGVYGSVVRFSHTIFAMPFALAMLLVAMRDHHVALSQFGWILTALVSARTAAMACNRLVDVDFDRRNPRTAVRELVRGAVSRREVTALLVASSLVFLAASGMLGTHCLVLAPAVLVILLGYSFTKRFTSLSHVVLGLALACAPGGVWYAITARFSWEPIPMMLGVLMWVAGFDIIYACQDVAFDRAEGLRSIPSRLGIGRALLSARILHLGALAALYVFGVLNGLGPPATVGLILFGAAMLSQHQLVSADDLSKVDIAFFTRNGVAGFLYFLGIAVDLAR